jgi:hypothetical protein
MELERFLIMDDKDGKDNSGNDMEYIRMDSEYSISGRLSVRLGGLFPVGIFTEKA